MRKAVVSRTFKVTKAQAVCIDKSNESVVTFDFDLKKTTDEKKVLKFAKEKFENETMKVSYVKILDTIYTTYAMPEEEFLQYAKPIE